MNREWIAHLCLLDLLVNFDSAGINHLHVVRLRYVNMNQYMFHVHLFFMYLEHR